MTWISPNGTTKNGIDFFLTNRPHTATDVSAINRLKSRSDHRMIRMSLTIDSKLERTKLIKQHKKPNSQGLADKSSQF